jgi:hypothetical protein
MNFVNKLIIICLFAIVSYDAFPQNIYLVSVGIADYPGTANDLRLSVSDAHSIANLYGSHSMAKTRVLTNNDATRQHIILAATSSFAKAIGDDMLVFYFSGHGCRQGFWAYDSLLTYLDIKKIFSGSKSRHKMIFADSCFSGKLRDSTSCNKLSKIDVDVLLFLSSRNNEMSIEFPKMRNSLFTACLIRCLKGGADINMDRIITAKELFDGVSKGVIYMSGGRQHPVMWGNFKDNIMIIEW